MLLDLFQAVDANNVMLPRKVSDIMDHWVLQMGFPVVTIDTANGQLTQNHFLLDPESTVDRPSPFGYSQFYFSKEKNKKYTLFTLMCD